MNRGVDERIADVRRLLAAARVVYEGRARIAPEIVRATGLTPEGVELGFSRLEIDATDAHLRDLVAAAGDAEAVHVILSANVFVAPLRALAIARAASDHVTVRPSHRDPTLARALVDVACDGAIDLVSERDVGTVESGEIHVYGRDATIDAVRAAARSVVIVVGHGAGLGVAIVTSAADVDEAAEALASDIVPFDQRGCLSPRVVLVEGGGPRSEAFALALHERLGAWGERVPRGRLVEGEREAAVRWRETLAFTGRVWSGPQHSVGLAPPDAAVTVPPSGRHVHVMAVDGLDAAAAKLAPMARFVVAVGTDDPGRVRAPAHARVGLLGAMQRPPLDGPVDRRSR